MLSGFTFLNPACGFCRKLNHISDPNHVVQFPTMKESHEGIDTDCSVAIHCCKSDQPFQWKMPDFEPPKSHYPLS